jgi:hypothetical protein
MRSLLRPLCAPVGFGILCLPLLLTGCGQPVRQDRSINWSANGSSVSFQHDGEGVFLVDKDTGKLTKIFQPAADVLATGSPLWSPAGKRVIFTTARPASPGQPTPPILPGLTPDPAGNIYLKQELVYACYLYEEGNPPPQPVKLFEASCDHVGYVAANLAVRWHPRGDRVLYLDRAADGSHGLFAYDLAAKISKQAFPFTADALIFDWTPDGSHLTCVLADQQQPQNDGIWIDQQDGEWWHVPGSTSLGWAELPSTLERLRATRPAWTADGKHFAFATWTPPQTANAPGQSSLLLGTLAGHKVETLAAGPEPFRDLHWTADGERLGVVRSSDNATLHIAAKDGTLHPPINRRPVRQFAGWNATGKRLAYLVPDGKPSEAIEWAFLLIPEQRPRDAVYVADGAGTESGREVFSGMRVTFPQWSPKDDKLSLWFTFTPTHRSVLSLLLGGGLRRGDPAAIFDPTTGKLSWLAVNAFEKAQVGHYYLLKRDYTQAWKWYEEAEKDWPQPKPADPAVTHETFRQLFEPSDIRFFEYYCLTKLGRKDDAKVKLTEFRKSFPRRPDQVQDASLQQVLDPDGLIAPLMRDLYCAEVFLSLDAADDAETYFRDEMKSASTDGARLSSAVVLGQILLLQNKRREYTDLATDTLAPLLFKLTKDQPPAVPPGADPQLEMQIGGQFALLPLCSPSFLKGMQEKDVQALLDRWQKLPDQATTKEARRQSDLVLCAAYQRLGMDKERTEAAQRLAANPAAVPLLAGNDIDKDLDQLRALLKMWTQQQ